MTTKPSPWDWAPSFRAHEAACLIAGTPMPQSLNPSKEELPADARPVRTSILVAYVMGEIYKAGKPVREDYPVEITLTSSEESEEFTVDSFTKARFLREELYRWLNATGRHSEYSFAPTHQAVAVAVMPAQASEAPQPAPAAPPEAVLMPPEAQVFGANTAAAPVSRKSRIDLLTPMIEKAVRECDGRTDSAEIFIILRTWAQEKPPRQPLMGVTDKGIQWTNSNDAPQELTRDALTKRLKTRR